MAGVAGLHKSRRNKHLAFCLGVAWAWLGRGLGVAWAWQRFRFWAENRPLLHGAQFLSCTRISSADSVQNSPPLPSSAIPAPWPALAAYDSFRGTIASANNIQSFQQPGRHTKPCGIQARDTGLPSQGLPCPSSDALPGSARWPEPPGWSPAACTSAPGCRVKARALAQLLGHGAAPSRPIRVDRQCK